MTACPPAEEELQPLLENDMWELWLIDRASGPTDQVHQAIASQFVEIMRAIVAKKPRVVVLPVRYYSAAHYITEVQAPSLDPTKEYVLLVSLDLGVVGGHYAICYAFNGKVDVFDSMTSASGPGAYTSIFLAIAKAYFPGRTINTIQPSPGEATLQATGGFFWIPPTFMKRTTGDIKKDRLLRLCNHQAQDHFCWAWCLLYLQSRILSYDLGPTRRWLARTNFPPVVLIKTYVQLLMSWRGITLSPELQQDFMSVWDAEDRLDPEDYRRYVIDVPETVQSLKDVLPPLEVKLTRQELRFPVPDLCLL